jgi:hypothetical protein
MFDTKWPRVVSSSKAKLCHAMIYQRELSSGGLSILFARCHMKSRLAILFAVIFCFLALSAPLFAHHGNSAYDMSKTVPMKATVTKFEYSNPHTQVYYDVTDDKGNVEHWVAETTNPAMLNRVGWTKDTLKEGDQVTLYVNPNKVGAKVTFLQKVVFPDGKELSTAKGF